MFSVERHESAGVKHLHLSGVIDEFADLSFFAHLEGDVVVHLGEVRRINSFGVRLWIDGVRAIPAESTVVYVDVPVPLVEQMNMIHDFFGRGRVESFLAPMACNSCGRNETVLFRVEECLRGEVVRLERQCSACDATMELDDIEEQYLAFLRDF
jgi:hypothetical protein